LLVSNRKKRKSLAGLALLEMMRMKKKAQASSLTKKLTRDGSALPRSKKRSQKALQATKAPLQLLRQKTRLLRSRRKKKRARRAGSPTTASRRTGQRTRK